MPNSNRSTEVEEYLRERVRSGEWPVNSRIPTEAELAETLKVGRSSVREAVGALARLGILEPAPSRGTYVRSRFPVPALLGDVMQGFAAADLLVMRRAIEVEAAQRAAELPDPEKLRMLAQAHAADLTSVGLDASVGSGLVERGRIPGHFHSLIVEMSQSPVLMATYSGVLAAIRSAVQRGDLLPAGSAARRHSDHAALLAAIEAGAPEGARLVWTEHVSRDVVRGPGEAP